MVDKASTSSDISMVPISAAKEEPERPATMMAVIIGPNSRVIEIPTPRWTAYDANRYEITMPAEAEMITTERAYTSPIWYTPNK